MARKCMFTGKRPNAANNVSHSHVKTKKRQLPNLQWRKMWWPEGNAWVRIKLSTRAMRTIDKLGLGRFAAAQGINLAKFAVEA